jgi:Mrp family chromosome partitioning ATPase
MTALDTAIIKAYLRQGGLPTPDEVEPNESTCPDVAPEETVRAVPPESKQPSRHRQPAGATQPASVPFDALELTGSALPSGIAEAITRLDAGVGASASVGLESGWTSGETVKTRSVASTESPDASFEPMLRVDAVSWPRPSRRLRQVASGQIERLADAVRKNADTGGKLIGVAGFSHGEGCTTVLLAVALRLVELGQKTLLIDGDVLRPRLAEQLALDNETGWRDVALGSVPLEDVVTQSDSECLALLPYCGQMTPMDGPEPSERATKHLLDRLRPHYDLILVDLGGALTSGGDGAALAERLAEQIDSVLTVHNVRVTSPSHLARLRQHLQRLGVQETGIIENFVDDEAS